MRLPRGWIECESKTKDGKKYYLNKYTKERSWTFPIDDNASESLAPQKKYSKTPAQDRLHRLQNQLQKKVAGEKLRSNSVSLPSPNASRISKETKKDFLKMKLPSENEVKCRKRKIEESDDSVVGKRLNIVPLPNECSDNHVQSNCIEKKPNRVDNFVCNDNDASFSSTSTTNDPSLYLKSKNSAILFANKMKMSANTRLELLRIALRKTSKKCKGNGEMEEKPPPYDFNKYQSLPNVPSTNNSNDKLLANSNTADYETEKMDWEDIGNNFEEQKEEFSSYTDIVKQNLIKLMEESADESIDLNIDAFYIVIDTNIFLRNLSFLDSLINMQFNDQSIVLYVPYCVLQELDKIKSNKSNSIYLHAQRAVRFINEKFEENSSLVKGQSAIEDKDKLIEIHCADDKILNCCLQLKRHVRNVLLLSNDINLRNKAICNQINVSTKANLERLTL